MFTFVPRQGKTVTLKLKTVKFESTTRAQSLLNATCELEQIYSAARDLLRAEMQNAAPEPLHLRLMGNRCVLFLVFSYFFFYSQVGIKHVYYEIKIDQPFLQSLKSVCPINLQFFNLKYTLHF